MPSALAPAAETTWGAYIYDTTLTPDELSPLEELALNNTDQATILKLSFFHGIAGDVLGTAFNTSVPAWVQIDQATDWASTWTSLYTNGSAGHQGNFKDPAPIQTDAIYRIKINID